MDKEEDSSDENVHGRTTMLKLQGAKATAKDLPNCGGNTSLWSLRQEGVDHHLQEIKKSENLVQHRNLINEVPTAKIDRTNDDGTDNRHDGLTHCASGAYFTAQKEGADEEQRLVSQEEALVAQHPSSISHITPDMAQTVMELQQRLKINIEHPRMTCCSSDRNGVNESSRNNNLRRIGGSSSQTSNNTNNEQKVTTTMDDESINIGHHISAITEGAPRYNQRRPQKGLPASKETQKVSLDDTSSNHSQDGILVIADKKMGTAESAKAWILNRRQKQDASNASKSKAQFGCNATRVSTKAKTANTKSASIAATTTEQKALCAVPVPLRLRGNKIATVLLTKEAGHSFSNSNIVSHFSSDDKPFTFDEKEEESKRRISCCIVQRSGINNYAETREQSSELVKTGTNDGDKALTVRRNAWQSIADSSIAELIKKGNGDFAATIRRQVAKAPDTALQLGGDVSPAESTTERTQDVSFLGTLDWYDPVWYWVVSTGLLPDKRMLGRWYGVPSKGSTTPSASYVLGKSGRVDIQENVCAISTEERASPEFIESLRLFDQATMPKSGDSSVEEEEEELDVGPATLDDGLVLSVETSTKAKTQFARRTHKFGRELPTTEKQALEIDRKNGNHLWEEALAREMKNASNAFELVEREPILQALTHIPSHLFLGIKTYYLSWKAGFVTDGHKVDPPRCSTRSAVVETGNSARIAFLGAALYGRKNSTTDDAQDAYLEAQSSQRCNSVMIGLQNSAKCRKDRIHEMLKEIGFLPRSLANLNVWIKLVTNSVSGDRYYEYVLISLDDILVMSSNITLRS